MGVPYTSEQLKNLGLIEVNGIYVKASSLTAKKVDKLPPLNVKQVYQDENPTMLDFVKNISNLNTKDLTPAQIMDIYKNTPDQVFGSNKKIRNAVKTVVNGIKFDSLLERYMYDLLKGAGIDFLFQYKYILQEKFHYGKEVIRPITLTVDFILSNPCLIIDTKGIQTQQGAIKWKILKLKLITKQNEFDLGTPTKIIMPKDKKECDLLLNNILYGKL